jgi:hypothetical protein
LDPLFCSQFQSKTGYLAADLRKWRKKKPRNNDLLAQIETQLLDQQKLHPSQHNHTLQQQLTEKHQNLLAKEEAYHIQLAKKRWAVMGDRNTSFFHQAIVKRNHKNRITHLINPDGSHSTTPQQLADTLVNYFTSIFTSQFTNFGPMATSFTHMPTNPNHFLVPGAEQPHPIETTDSHQQLMEEEEATQNNELFRYTYSIPDLNELHDLIRHMRSNAAPGPDGFNAAFYKSAWSWIQQDIQKLVTDFYTYAHMPTEINQTFITLIPKKNQPTTPQD